MALDVFSFPVLLLIQCGIIPTDNMEKKQQQDIRTFDLSSHDCFVNKGEIICTKSLCVCAFPSSSSLMDMQEKFSHIHECAPGACTRLH